MSRTRTTMAVLAGVGLTVAACGGDEHAAAPRATPPASPVSASTTTAPAVTDARRAGSSSTSPATEPTVAPTESSAVDEAWRQEVEAACGDLAVLASIAEHDGTVDSIIARAAAIRAVYEEPFGASIAVPAALRQTLDALAAEAMASLDASVELAGNGDLAGAELALEKGWDVFSRTGTAIALAGARCAFADPARVATADLTVPLEMDPNQLNVAFGSVWVSEIAAGRVVRLDPTTGALQATVDVGAVPLKAQPADGLMWVRTAAAYVGIEPTTNTVTATLAKADVGPAANRSWAVDGAMWICDGRRLHRYDPTTLVPVAALDLELDCNAVYATTDLAVAWSYNEDVGESGTSAAAFIDPATNTVLATVALPFDVGGPALLPDAAYFHGYHGSSAVVVDLTSWTIAATPDHGVHGGGTGQAAFDGTSIYFPDAAEQDVVRVDATTFDVVEIIEPLGVNAVAVDDTGALWVARGQPLDVVQRFDVGRP
jgi:hypothetical protein